MNTSLSPYLNFDGQCEEAMNFYQTVFGGKLEISRFSDYKMPTSPEWQNKVMHSTLKDGVVSFMASDAMQNMSLVKGNNVSLSVAGTDEPSLTKMFNDLSVGGQITMPLAKQVWGDIFGMLTDKFGMHWMFNIGMMGAEEKKA